MNLNRKRDAPDVVCGLGDPVCESPTARRMLLWKGAGINNLDTCSNKHADVNLYLVAETDDAEEVIYGDAADAIN